MVIDTSAIVAILLQEPDAAKYAECIADAPIRLISAVTRVELSFVLEGSRSNERAQAEIKEFLLNGEIRITAVTPEQAELAIQAFRRYGKGRHPARLNIGDCFAYALAKATDLPLLFKGADFSQTDVRSALPS
jgi:ribonuclease VapC